MSATIALTVITTGPSCGKNNGSINILAASGVTPYAYSITGFLPQASGFFSQLAPGNYNIIVTDANGDQTDSSVALINTFSSPTASVATSSFPTGCNTRDASITITASGGQPAYLYSIDQIHYQADNYFPGLTAGLYQCVVKDSNGCESQTSIFNNLTINENCPIHENGVTTSYTCNPFLTYLGLINVSGGTPPYLYSLDGVNYQTDNDYTNGVPADIYTFWVKDSTGLILLYTVAVPDRCSPALTIITITLAAQCGQNGKITVSVTDGTGPYQYSIDGITFQNSNVFAGLMPGNYTIYVKDANNLLSSKYVILGNNCLSVIANAISSTCGSSNGTLNAQATMGVAPYLFSIDSVNFNAMGNFINLMAGTYTITVKDANGSVGSTSVIVGNINGPVLTATINTQTGCVNNTGTIELLSQGGTAPLMYSTDGTIYNNQALFTGLGAGQYTVYVKDSNGCIASAQSIIGTVNDITVDAGDSISICEGDSITLNASTNALQFSWVASPGLSNISSLHPVVSPVQSSVYYLNATTFACSATDSVYIKVKPAPIANAGQGQTICFGKNAYLHGSGGVSGIWNPSIYINDPNSFDPVAIKPEKSITYSLNVTGADGCPSLNAGSIIIKVTPPAKVFAGNDTSIVTGVPFSLHAADINNSGFDQYTWTPSNGLSNPYVQSPLAQVNVNTNFVVVARTPAGCEGTDAIFIKVFTRSDIFVPTAFTPNADGKNDILKALPVGIKTFKYFAVYNRYGLKVFYTTDSNIGWNGKTKDVLNNTGGFVWIACGIDFQNNQLVRKGNVMLIH